MIFLFGIGGFEILLIFLVVLLLFGAKQLPEFARILGRSWGTIKRTTEEVRREFEEQASVLERESKNIINESEKHTKEQ